MFWWKAPQKHLLINMWPLRIFITNKYCPGRLTAARSGIRQKHRLCGEAGLQTTPEERFPSPAALKQKGSDTSHLQRSNWTQPRKHCYGSRFSELHKWKNPTHSRDNLKIAQISPNFSTSYIWGGGIHASSPARTTFCWCHLFLSKNCQNLPVEVEKGIEQVWLGRLQLPALGEENM